MSNDAIIVKLHRHIEVVTIDTTGMRETGFGSLKTCQSVYDVLKSRYDRVDFIVVQNEGDLKRIVNREPDLVVLCVKYVVDEEQDTEIWLSDYFSHFDIAHTGSNRATLEFDSDKSKAKNVLLAKGVATAKFFLTRPGLFKTERHLPLALPLFVKPLDAANGIGIDENSLVHDFASYEAKVEEIFTTYASPVLVEIFLPGREFTVAILDDAAANVCVALPVEVIAPKNAKGDRVLGYQEKSSNKEELLQVRDPALSAVAALAKKAFSVLGGRDFGRVDVKMDAKGMPHFIEANLVPGMTPKTSYFPRACNLTGMMSYESVVLKMIEIALNRIERPAYVMP